MISVNQHMNDLSSEGKTALITGAARRIGKAMAQHLAASGWNIAIHYNHSETDAALLMKSLSGKFPVQKFLIFKADLANHEEVADLLPQLINSM